jgi:hypothetical protein
MSSNSDHLLLSDSDDELILSDDDKTLATYAVMQAAYMNTQSPLVLERLNQCYVERAGGVRDQLFILRRMPSLFATMTNFTVEEFEELSNLVCPMIAGNARLTGLPRSGRGRRYKLDPPQRLLSFILYLKHDNTSIFDGSQWNWSKSSMCDDALFVGSCVNAAMTNEIRWPTAAERQSAATRIPQFAGCIGYVDGTLCKIRRPYKDPQHSRWFNGRKKIYSVNNTVVVDHDGLFIYIDSGFPGSYHDVSILRASSLYQNWRSHFEHRDDYFEYLLGDPGYIGEDMFIMRRMAAREIPVESQAVMEAFNKVHAGVRVQVEWGIGGMKRKWKRMMKTFDATKPKFTIIFKSACILTNFLHRRRMNMVARDNVNDDEEGEGWAGDF